MNCLEKIKKLFDKRENEDKKENVPRIVYENKDIEKECDEWIKYLGVYSFGSVLLDVGFKPEDCVYLYDNGCNDLEFYYSVNNEEKNINNKVNFSYGAFMDRGAQITIENGNKMKSYAFYSGNKFEINLEKTKVSDVLTYERYYFPFSSVLMINSRIKDKNYELKLSIYRSFDNEDIFMLENESELEKYLCSLELPVSMLDVFKKICEICNLDVSKYDSFDLELCKKFRNAKDVISHIKFRDGEFVSLSYIKDNKKIGLNSSGDWSYEMIDEDDLAKLSITVKDNNVSCNIDSKNEKEIDDYFKYLALYDINTARCEIDEAKKLVRSMFNK